jgi:phosphatidate phosphatase PAH1
MFRKDYIQKLLEQLSIAIAKVIVNVNKANEDGNTSEALEISDSALQSEFDLELNDLIALHPEETIGFLTEQKQLIPGKLNLLADLLFATTNAYEKSGNNIIAKNLLKKTLLLYEYVNLTEKTFLQSRQQNINTIKTRLYELE